MTSTATNAAPTPATRPGPLFWLALGAMLGVLLWAYWPNLGDMAHAWAHRAHDSHGYLVPGFAALLLWLRRDRLDLNALSPTWWGALILLGGVALRAYGTFHYRLWLDAVSLLPTLAGLTLLMGGWTALRWAGPAIAFLFFMIPLPFSVASTMSGPLQTLATLCSTFLLQTLGMPAVAEGNIIRINDAQIGIVEACSGLKMLVVFFALSTGMVLVINAPLGDKLFLVASSVPIALASNIIRITITGLLHELVDGELANVFFHDVAGWFMMPLALGMLWLELKVLSKLLIEVPYNPSSRGNRNSPRSPAPPRARSSRSASTVQQAVAPPASAAAQPQQAPEPSQPTVSGQLSSVS